MIDFTVACLKGHIVRGLRWRRAPVAGVVLWLQALASYLASELYLPEGARMHTYMCAQSHRSLPCGVQGGNSMLHGDIQFHYSLCFHAFQLMRTSGGRSRHTALMFPPVFSD